MIKFLIFDLKMESALLDQGKPHSADFLTIDCRGIASAASKSAREWIKATSNAMKELDTPKYFNNVL